MTAPGHLFSTFEDFLAFSWPCITCTDVWTGHAHINASRPLRTVSDYASYKRLHSALSAAVLSAYKLRVRAGEPKAVRELWASRDRTFPAIDFEWSERNEKGCLEWGMQLYDVGIWSRSDIGLRPGRELPVTILCKSTSIKHCPTHPWQYAFGDSQVCPKAKLPQIIQAVISGDLARMEEMKIKLPHSMFILDTATFERALFAGGHRATMIDPHTSTPGNPKPRGQGSTLSLENLLRSLASPSDPHSHNPALQTQVLVPGQFPQPGAMVPGVVMHNSGNDAFMCLYALQLLLQPDGRL
ncbi:hypothetical protein K438DRAFT_1989504 [Mycena galopus ATCC 62051]|nr:hypothetical protein K438DRAFT_1989504 [Mycena galopus ATCC 62051]